MKDPSLEKESKNKNAITELFFHLQVDTKFSNRVKRHLKDLGCQRCGCVEGPATCLPLRTRSMICLKKYQL